MTSAKIPGDDAQAAGEVSASGTASGPAQGGVGDILLAGIAQSAAQAGAAAALGNGPGAAAAAGAAGALIGAGLAALGSLPSASGSGGVSSAAPGAAPGSPGGSGGWGAGTTAGSGGGPAGWSAGTTAGASDAPGGWKASAGIGLPGAQQANPAATVGVAAASKVGAAAAGAVAQTLGTALPPAAQAALGGAIPQGLAGGAVAGLAGGITASVPPGLTSTVPGTPIPGGPGGLTSSLPDGLTSSLPGGLTSSLPGGLAGGISSGIVPGAPGGILAAGVPEPELPIFEDIAVTAGPGKSALEQVDNLVGGAIGGALASLGGKNIEVEVASGDALDVRNFSVHERISSLFQVNLVAVSDNASIDFDAVVGQKARFAVRTGAGERSWIGLCNHIEQVRTEPDGKSTYQLSIVPRLWLLTQRRNYRMFQQLSEPDIVLEILKEWGIEPEVRIDKGAYKKRKYRVQYAESDFAFVSRMLEDAGICYHFEQSDDDLVLVLSDSPHTNPERPGSLSFVDDTSMVKKNDNETVTAVRVGQRVRPGKVTLRDHDYRRPPTYALMTTASAGKDPETDLERFHYVPGAFLFGTDQGDATPVADDKGKARTDEKAGRVLAQRRLDAKRGSALVCTFETNAHDLAPGMVISISNHPHEALGQGKKLLLMESSFNGTATGDWSQYCEARSTDVPFRPELVTPRPRVSGVESATVVGPKGEEIHTDEFGRVRVHFHWDRKSKLDDNSSCWIHVSQPWAGAGYGAIHLPRVGQEVLVDFLSGDPDRPVIVGRVYTNLQKVPYKLPQNKTRSGWKSNSTGNTGGYNEIMFEDMQGKELVNIQAQKDLTELVKNDASHTVKNDRTTTVWNNNTQLVGKEHSLTIAESVTPEGPQAGPTKVTMVHERIELTTGKASIILDGPNIILRADNDITTAAVMNVNTSALAGNIGLTALAAQISLMGVAGISASTPSVVTIDGATAVLINCTSPAGKTDLPQPSLLDRTMNALSGGVTNAILAVAISAAPIVGILMGGSMMAEAVSDGIRGR